MAENAGQIQTTEHNTPNRRISALVPVLKKALRLKIIIPLALLIMVGAFSPRIMGAIRQGPYYQRVFCPVPPSAQDGQSLREDPSGGKSAFKPSSGGQLVSSQTLLKLVGRTPGEPDRSLFSALEKVGPAGKEEAPKKEAAADVQQRGPNPATAQPQGAGSGSDAPVGPLPAINLAVTPPGPSPEKAGREEKTVVPVVEPAPEVPPGPERKATGPGDADKSRAPVQQTPRPAMGGEKEPKVAPEDPDNRPEKFQLPGSLTVNIPDYQGSLMHVGLLVILDNSREMGKKTKIWAPNRSSFSIDMISKIAKALPPGSRLTVRDFLCNKPSGHDPAPAKPCPCRKLYEWSKAPFEGLKGRLDKISTVGTNNPCAAAAFALKGDFSGVGDLVPRILILTGGVRKCTAGEVLKAMKESGSRSRPAVDVITIGSHRKTAKGYSVLASKTGGVFLRAEKPVDVNVAISRYQKVLTARTLEKIEVKGEKKVLSIVPNDEFPMEPGSYKIILPAIHGLGPAQREIKNIKIESGKNTAVEVKIRKGRPTIKMGRN